ncbi:hypothetical protein [Burkholderia pyrrocinia]|uniref:hypothetical protein n=1 Tax=Burkholderia pyrrocinia TaxID=60550 RepID=UPI00158A1C0D|nr:hypothetical protein [Burkholderia pyrrocinia]
MAASAPIVIRYTEDGWSLLIGRVADSQKNNECGDNADFVRYFLIMWRIELKAFVRKGLGDFSGVNA